MARQRALQSRSRYAILGVLNHHPATGYEIRKVLSETTAHFWKESYGQIYPTLEQLHADGKIELHSETTGGRMSKRYRILSPGREELTRWIRGTDLVLKPGRNELLLKLFFARAQDAPFLRPQVDSYRAMMDQYRATYQRILQEHATEGLPRDAELLMGSTIDYGLAAAEMQIAWCERTAAVLDSLEDAP